MSTTNTLLARIAAVLAMADSAPESSPAAALSNFIANRLIDQGRCETVEEAIEFLATKGESYEGDGWYGNFGVNVYELADGSLQEQWGYSGECYTTCTLVDLLRSAEGASRVMTWYDDEWVTREAA